MLFHQNNELLVRISHVSSLLLGELPRLAANSIAADGKKLKYNGLAAHRCIWQDSLQASRSFSPLNDTWFAVYSLP